MELCLEKSGKDLTETPNHVYLVVPIEVCIVLLVAPIGTNLEALTAWNEH